MGTQPVDDYCREIEGYLCRKNDGHLIRVVGPSFDLVSGWAERGVPLKVAFEGIDRSFERYYRRGPRRRPLKIDFCEADVLDAFDEWRRAIGLTTAGVDDVHEQPPAGERRGGSLPAHLERAVLRLTAARTGGRLGPSFDALIDRVARELDTARATTGGIRGETRRALVDRLAAIDAELLQAARTALDADVRTAVEREAEQEIAGYRDRMAPDAFARVRDAAIDRLVRERLQLPEIAYRC